MENFTREETDWLIAQFNQMKVCPMAPDAIGLCERIQSIANKMEKLTDADTPFKTDNPRG